MDNVVQPVGALRLLKPGLSDRLNEVCVKALFKFGKPIQKDVAIGELAELIQAIINEKRGREGSYKNVLEEMADVCIMMSQLMIVYDCDGLLDSYIEEKLDRMEKWLK